MLAFYFILQYISYLVSRLYKVYIVIQSTFVLLQILNKSKLLVIFTKRR